jgi:hypothetical protein
LAAERDRHEKQMNAMKEAEEERKRKVIWAFFLSLLSSILPIQFSCIITDIKSELLFFNIIKIWQRDENCVECTTYFHTKQLCFFLIVWIFTSALTRSGMFGL